MKNLNLNLKYFSLCNQTNVSTVIEDNLRFCNVTNI